MFNRANVRIFGAGLIAIASLCFSACGAEENAPDPGAPGSDPGDPGGSDTHEKVLSSAMRDGLDPVVQPEPGEERDWKPTHRAVASGDHRHPNCLASTAITNLPTLPNTTNTTNQFTVPLRSLPVCRTAVPTLPVAPLPPAGDEAVQMIQRD